ncbi:hypothetical protein [Nocardia seriolae]|nr:hypothetical protein [Nocardia seriolae]QOW36711.1 hypothetical protein IMZ23_18810 [Nocardia seriolae]QUN15773.1 hypothetical protein KEC46_26090 [Nocardia seriolae]WKY54607.1 hypothetical protein Q5P07_11530 [Nocardia seriolae]WNJ57199.1 hypothetical protein RMO66_27720 [Nocardia seriolae]
MDEQIDRFVYGQIGLANVTCFLSDVPAVLAVYSLLVFIQRVHGRGGFGETRLLAIGLVLIAMTTLYLAGAASRVPAAAIVAVDSIGSDAYTAVFSLTLITAGVLLLFTALQTRADPAAGERLRKSMLGLIFAILVALVYPVGMLMIEVALSHHYAFWRRNIFNIAWITAAPGCVALAAAGMCGLVRELGRFR